MRPIDLIVLALAIGLTRLLLPLVDPPFVDPRRGSGIKHDVHAREQA